MSNYQTQAYKQTKIKTAGQGQIIVMLYDEAVRQIGIALDLLKSESKELDKVNNAILKAKDIITELMVSLDLEQGGEFASQMFSVYRWFNEQLMEANIKKEPLLLEQIRAMLVEIRDAWSQIAGKTTVKGGNNEQGGLNIAG